MTTSYLGRYLPEDNLYNLQDVSGNNLQDVSGRQVQVYGAFYVSATSWIGRSTP